MSFGRFNYDDSWIDNKYTKSTNTNSGDRITWEEYFMSLAILSSKRSADPVTQVGACLVDMQNKVVSIGYNGMPHGCKDEDLSWNKNDGLDNKKLYVCHAELNAILNTSDPRRLVGGTAYVTLFPCNECAKALIQAGIMEVVYLKNDKANQVEALAAKKLFDSAGIGYRPYNGRYTDIKLS